MPPTNRSTEALFWAKVNKAGPVPDHRPDLGPCWVWLAGKNSGYGRFWASGGHQYAHRFSYEKLRGRVKGGLYLDHLCRNRACVNPDHLEPVTNRENCQRGETGAYQLAKTHCPQGHPYSGDNLYRHNGKRHCRTCMRDSLRRRRAAERKAA